MYRNITNLYCAALVVLLLIGTVWFLLRTDWKENDLDLYSLRKCYEYDTKRSLNITEPHWFLDDILNATRQPQPGRTIFFHLTNCLNLTIEITNRQACAIESAAKLNPEWDIFILFASPVVFSLDMTLATRTLLKYPNIHWRNVDIWTYPLDTPAQEWILKKEPLLRSKFLVVHLSDFLRLVSLYRYGGTHMDHDFISIKSISNMEPNYACAASDDSVNNAILNFEHDGFGHEFAHDMVRDFARHYNGDSFAQNGPMLLTRLLARLCKSGKTFKMKRELCKFEVMPREAFYAINWRRWKLLFDEKHAAEAELLTNNSMAVHFWNACSNKEIIRIGSDKPPAYEKLAKEFCPLVYGSLDEFF